MMMLSVALSESAGRSQESDRTGSQIWIKPYPSLSISLPLLCFVIITSCTPHPLAIEDHAFEFGC
jgi:hypothetical protein